MTLQANPVLRKIFDTGQVRAAGGEHLEETSGIRREFADALYRTVLARRPHLVVEVGMANGVSSLAILTALQEAGTGRLISIDPYQSTDWRSIGVNNVRDAGLSGRHELIEQPDYVALPDLLRARTRVDFAYIDGWHTFDYTLLNFWYLDRMLPQAGVVAFNDCHLQSVHKVIGFVKSHRRYQELDVGLAPEFGAGPLSIRGGLSRLRRRLTGRNSADRYFQKLQEWEPPWDYFAAF